MAVRAAKAALRREVKARICNLCDLEKQRQSNVVVEKLFTTTEYQQSHRISVFLSMPDEISTKEILKQIFIDKKMCFIPRYYKGGNKMDMVLLESEAAFDKLPVTSWNIKQPPEDAELPTAIDSGGLDLILIPGLAFTIAGHRLGRGRGYYDTYLSRHLDMFGYRPKTIGLAFIEQIYEEVPCSSDDVMIDKVLYSSN